MKKLVDNPFLFGVPVQGAFFFPLPQLSTTITRFIEGRINIVIQGPRRFGKTSFVLDLLEKMESRGYECIYVDVFNITSHNDFLSQVVSALNKRKGLKEWVRDWTTQFSRLQPRLEATVDPHTGTPKLSLSAKVVSPEDSKELIQDILSSMELLSEKVLFVIDEFQQVSQIDDHHWLEATLRSRMQESRNVTYLFTGSRKSLISDMLNDHARPFYRSCQMVEFPEFGSEFDEWIIHRFRSIGIECQKEAISFLRKAVQSTPNYIQQACFHLAAERIPLVQVADMKRVLETIVRQNSYAYQTLLSSLSLTQQRVLRLAAHEDGQLYRKTLLERYEIASAAALASSIKALKSKQILEDTAISGSVNFDDPLFAIWLRVQFPKS